ncbi:MAG: hypothetical protein QMD80_07300 [archaeon]|nr:hypothetical protein [archaeon]
METYQRYLTPGFEPFDPLELARKHPSGANQLLAMAKPWVVPIR